MDQRISKKNRGQTYFQYLVKWKEKTMEDSSWLTAAKLKRYRISPENLKEKYFLPWESDAGASELASNVEICSHVVAKQGEIH